MTDEADDPLQPDLSGDSVTRLARRADSLLFSLAQTTDEITQAYRLVYRNYLRSEYIDPHPSEMRYTVFNALPKTATFIARLRDAVTTTASVIFDSPLGLPLEAIYHEEVDELRRNNARLCEVTMLADRRRAGMRTIPAILQLFKLVFHYTLRFEKTTDIVITINPSHEAFYTRYLPFEDLAGLRRYPSVKGAPAIAKRANLARIVRDARTLRLGDFFVDSPPSLDMFGEKKRFTQDELRELFVLKREILPKLPKHAVDYVRSQYPDYDFERIMAPARK